MTGDCFIAFDSRGVSLLVDVSSGRLPAIVHWGASLGELSHADARALRDADIAPATGNVVDRPIRLSILPESWTGWMGEPGLSGSRAGSAWSPQFTVRDIALDGAAISAPMQSVRAGVLRVTAVDDVAALTLRLEIEMLRSGLVRARAIVQNDHRETYQLDGLVLAFPIPPRAREVLDFAGRWGKERVPQRGELRVGRHQRDNRRGRTGLDTATVLTVGEAGFGFRAGEVWGTHVGFSGDHRHYAERLPHGVQVIGGGELLLPGEVRLEHRQQYCSPWVYASYGLGLDEQAGRFHAWLRSRPEHPHSNRPVTLNVWEAVGMDHNLERLRTLADRAAAVGVERYVLDDGWMLGRRNDLTGLGDWVVDPDVWPQGLHPLVDHVRGLGMEFGLWFEPEMISATSAAGRAHPEWILQTGDRLPVESRHQQVIDLTNPDAYQHVFEQVAAVLTEYDITYIKWDHNRDLVDAGHGAHRTPSVHEQTLATYRLMAALKQRFPRLEIESCSSGGGRVDLGVLQHTDRVWGSDCIDPLERQQINRWTMQLLPPELIGSHVGRNPDHSTDRTSRLSFRAGTALLSHFGIEWDLTDVDPKQLQELTEWVQLYKQLRPLLHTGAIVRMDPMNPELQVYGVVAPDRSEAAIFLGYLGQPTIAPLGRFTIAGLDPDKRYRVRPLFPGESMQGISPPAWFGIHPLVQPPIFADRLDVGYLNEIPAGVEAPGTVLSGRALAEAGLQAPTSTPDNVIVLHLTEVTH